MAKIVYLWVVSILRFTSVSPRVMVEYKHFEGQASRGRIFAWELRVK